MGTEKEHAARNLVWLLEQQVSQGELSIETLRVFVHCPKIEREARMNGELFGGSIRSSTYRPKQDRFSVRSLGNITIPEGEDYGEMHTGDSLEVLQLTWDGNANISECEGVMESFGNIRLGETGTNLVLASERLLQNLSPARTYLSPSLRRAVDIPGIYVPLRVGNCPHNSRKVSVRHGDLLSAQYALLLFKPASGQLSLL